jgi:hypothetical protein
MKEMKIKKKPNNEKWNYRYSLIIALQRSVKFDAGKRFSIRSYYFLYHVSLCRAIDVTCHTVRRKVISRNESFEIHAFHRKLYHLNNWMIIKIAGKLKLQRKGRHV